MGKNHQPDCQCSRAAQNAGCFGDMPPGWQPPALQLRPGSAAGAAAGQLPQLPGPISQPPVEQLPPGRAEALSQWRRQHAHPVLPCRRLSASPPPLEAACQPLSATCRSLPSSRPARAAAAAGPPPALQHSRLQTHSMPQLPAHHVLPLAAADPGLPRTPVDRFLEDTHDWWGVSSMLCGVDSIDHSNVMSGAAGTVGHATV